MKSEKQKIVLPTYQGSGTPVDQTAIAKYRRPLLTQSQGDGYQERLITIPPSLGKSHSIYIPKKKP